MDSNHEVTDLAFAPDTVKLDNVLPSNTTLDFAD